MFVEVTGEKLVERGDFFGHPILNNVKVNIKIVKLYMVNYNVTIFNRFKIMGFL